MVLFQLMLHARTENIQSIQMPSQGEWHCKIKCGGCNQQYPKQITLSTTQHIEVIKQKVNYFSKCKNCQRKGTMLITQNSSYIVNVDEYGVIHKAIAEIDCRGVQITKVIIGNSLTVNSKSGIVFENAELDDQWADYDEKLFDYCKIEYLEITIDRK